MSRPNSVLLVDPDPKVLRLLEATLRLKNLDVVKAETGIDALAAVRSRPADLVVVDTELAGIDAFELFTRMRAMPRFNALPFVFLSTRLERLDGTEVEGAGGVVLLRKPFAIEELLQRVDRALAEASTTPAPVDAIEGEFARVALSDLLRMLTVQRRTGQLGARFAGCAAPLRISVRGGRAHAAELGLLTGNLAIFQALCWRDGSFRFKGGTVDAGGNVEGETLPLLMEGFRLLDGGYCAGSTPRTRRRCGSSPPASARAGRRWCARIPRTLPLCASMGGDRPPSSTKRRLCSKGHRCRRWGSRKRTGPTTCGRPWSSIAVRSPSTTRSGTTPPPRRGGTASRCRRGKWEQGNPRLLRRRARAHQRARP